MPADAKGTEAKQQTTPGKFALVVISQYAFPAAHLTYLNVILFTFFFNNSGVVIAHHMGLGKTLSTIAFLHTVIRNQSIALRMALVIVPANVLCNWREEIESGRNQQKMSCSSGTTRVAVS